MKKRTHMFTILIYIVLLLIWITACEKQQFTQESTVISTDTNKEKIDFLQTAWSNSSGEPEKTDSWSVGKYIENFLPKITVGKLGTRLYAMDENYFWILSEIWKTGEDGKQEREYLITKYDMNSEQWDTFLYTFKWSDTITGFAYLKQGIEQLTCHIVGMDCVDGTFSFLMEGTDEENNSPLFYVLSAKEDGQVLSVTDISAVLLENHFDCPAKRMPSSFHKDRNGNLFIMEPEMLNVFVLNSDGTFSGILSPQTGTNLCFKGKLPGGEPVYDYSNKDGTMTLLTYHGSKEKCLYMGETYWSGGTFFSSYGQVFFTDNKGLKCWNVTDGTLEIVCDRIEAGIYEYLWFNNKDELFLISVGKNPYIVKLKNEPPQEVVELELCVTTQSQYVTACANAYSMRHPYVRINISEVSRFDANAMNKLFTDVSEGKGPDMMVLNRSDVISFHDAGALSDLSTVLTADTTEQIYPGVLDYGTVDDRLLGITCEATINTLFISHKVWNAERWNLQDAFALTNSKEAAGSPIRGVVASSVTPYQMLYDLALKDITNSGFVNLDTKTCDFDSKEFLMLLEHCKKYGKEATGDAYKDAEEMVAEINNGTYLAYAFSGNFAQFSTVKSMLGEDYHCVGYPSENKQGSFFQFYDGCVTINSQTSKLQEAKDFLRYLVDYSTQKKYGLNWVRKDVLLDSVQNAVEVYGYKEPIPVFFQSESEIIPLSGKEDGSSYVKEYIELAESCIPYKDEHSLINTIIIEEVPAFFSGQKSAEQVASIIQNRVTLFLEENS